jgi:hypothetical protein
MANKNIARAAPRHRAEPGSFRDHRNKRADKGVDSAIVRQNSFDKTETFLNVLLF